jgi:hypothetical protein
MGKSQPVYRDLAPLVRLTGIAIWTQTICYGFSFVADAIDLQQRSVLAGLNLGSDELEQRLVWSNLFLGLSNLITVIVVIFAAVMVLRSIYRADNNLHARGVAGLEYRPGWCVGWFFIPIASLWKPYQAFKEIWVASHDPVQFSIERPAIMPLWWTLFLISNITGNASGRLAFMDNAPEQQAATTILSLISIAATIPEGLILLNLLRQIARAQDRTLNIDMTFG